MAGRSFQSSLKVAQVSADLKCARSLVRTAEIKSTLLEARYAIFYYYRTIPITYVNLFQKQADTFHTVNFLGFITFIPDDYLLCSDLMN